MLQSVFYSLLFSPFSLMVVSDNITTGNLWTLVIVFTGIAPMLDAEIRKVIKQ